MIINIYIYIYSSNTIISHPHPPIRNMYLSEKKNSLKIIELKYQKIAVFPYKGPFEEGR